MSDTTPLLLIDANRLFRQGLVHLLEGAEFQVVAEAATVAEALSCDQALPGLILIDPVAGQQGADAVAALREAAPDARIVVLTGAVDATSLPLVLDAGADGYLLKDTTPEALVQKLKLVLLGEKVFPGSVCIAAPEPVQRYGVRRPRQPAVAARDADLAPLDEG